MTSPYHPRSSLLCCHPAPVLIHSFHKERRASQWRTMMMWWSASSSSSTVALTTESQQEKDGNSGTGGESRETLQLWGEKTGIKAMLLGSRWKALGGKELTPGSHHTHFQAFTYILFGAADPLSNWCWKRVLVIF